ncbi:hypothetical protein L2E82_50008 [Cichorium intybus]|nr:hypothetical protein L2E82_50008 [Cichorium intybus]
MVSLRRFAPFNRTHLIDYKVNHGRIYRSTYTCTYGFGLSGTDFQNSKDEKVRSKFVLWNGVYEVVKGGLAISNPEILSIKTVLNHVISYGVPGTCNPNMVMTLAGNKVDLEDR